jgi:DNA-binding response OmpR family regulator
MKRVLVVDDDPQVLSLTGRWLSAAGYDVVLADNFKDARTEIHVCAPEIVVIDVRLGEFNGVQLGLLSREARPDVHVVFISGWDDSGLRRDAAELEARYVQKPFRAADLLAAVTVTARHSPKPRQGNQRSDVLDAR